MLIGYTDKVLCNLWYYIYLEFGSELIDISIYSTVVLLRYWWSLGRPE